MTCPDPIRTKNAIPPDFVDPLENQACDDNPALDRFSWADDPLSDAGICSNADILFRSQAPLQSLGNGTVSSEEILKASAAQTTCLLLESTYSETSTREVGPLVLMSEEQISLLCLSGEIEEAVALLEGVATLYAEAGDPIGENFALGRARYLNGNWDESEAYFAKIPEKSELAVAAIEFRMQIDELNTLETQLLISLEPQLSALDQMSLRAVEQLSFEYGELTDTWLTAESSIESSKRLKLAHTRMILTGINEMRTALVTGRVTTLDEAFDRFSEYTTLRAYQNLAGFEATSWYTAPYQYVVDKMDPHDLPKMTGEGFRQALTLNNVDVDGLLLFSRIRKLQERQKWLLQYTQDLRSHYASLEGFPYETISYNIALLQESSVPEVKQKATVLASEINGETAWTGFSDGEYAAFLRSQQAELGPLIIGAMVAGPIGSAAAVRTAYVGYSIERGISLSRLALAGTAGLIAGGTGYWAVHDVAHATLIGHGDYFTPEGWGQAVLMMGGLGLAMGSWRLTAGNYLLGAAQAVPERAAIYGLANTTGQLALEWNSFVLLGHLSEGLGLIPSSDATWAQEYLAAGYALVGIKAGLSAGKTASNAVAAESLAARLEALEQNAWDALKSERLTETAYREMQNNIAMLRLMAHQLTGNPAFASSGGTGQAGPSRPSQIGTGTPIPALENGATIPGISFGTAATPWDLPVSVNQRIAEIYADTTMPIRERLRAAARVLMTARIGMIPDADRRALYSKDRLERHLSEAGTVIAGIEIRSKADLKTALLKFIQDEFGLEYEDVPTVGALKAAMFAKMLDPANGINIVETAKKLKLYQTYMLFYRSTVSLYLPLTDEVLINPEIMKPGVYNDVLQGFIRVHEIEHRVDSIGGGFGLQYSNGWTSKLYLALSLLPMSSRLISGPFQTYHLESFSIGAQWEYLHRIPEAVRAQLRTDIATEFAELQTGDVTLAKLQRLTAGEARKLIREKFPDNELKQKVWGLYVTDAELKDSALDKATYLQTARVRGLYDMWTLLTEFHQNEYKYYKKEEILNLYWYQKSLQALHIATTSAAWYYAASTLF